MAYGPVNVPGAAGAEAAAALAAAKEAKEAVAALEKSLREGTLEVKAAPVFPVLSEDPASPKTGEAWIKA